ncbi:MAG: hypothetical protein JW936_10625 [Sedimentisphaerales bacterium]|nr:hypothetical protein [Sedimentisphaerales bacterium]
MKNRQWLFLCVCLAVFSANAVCLATGSDPNSGSPDYVYTFINANDWIDAGSNPPYRIYSESYWGLADSTYGTWWANSCEGGADLTYRFEVPEGKVIDAVQMGITGWTVDEDHSIEVFANAQSLGSVYGVGPVMNFYFDASVALEVPAQSVSIRIHFNNDSDPCEPDAARVHSTWLAPGNDYEFAVHVSDKDDTYLVELDGSGAFDCRGPAEAFSDWARLNFNGAGMGTNDLGTMPPGADKTAIMLIPFRLPAGRVYETCRIDYGSRLHSYYDGEDPDSRTNNGYVAIDVTTSQGTTRIYQHNNPDDYGGLLFDDGFNYDPCGGDPNVPDTWSFRVFTDISDLIAGENVFELKITCRTGWSDWLYNGGIFLPLIEEWADCDFLMAGTTVEDPDPDTLGLNEFCLRARPDNFVPWAKSFGATGDMTTFYEGKWYSGTPTPMAGVSLSIPFSFPRALVDARLEYGSTLSGYESNWGYCKMDLITDESVTQIYYHQSPDYEGQPESMNYTPEGGVPNEGPGTYRVYTDIDDLVAGKTEFTLYIYAELGWSGFIYNGALFLPGMSLVGDSDFILSGHMVDSADFCGDDYTQYLDSDVSHDCYVNLPDLAIIASEWLQCTNPDDVDCTQHWDW